MATTLSVCSDNVDSRPNDDDDDDDDWDDLKFDYMQKATHCMTHTEFNRISTTLQRLTDAHNDPLHDQLEYDLEETYANFKDGQTYAWRGVLFWSEQFRWAAVTSSLDASSDNHPVYQPLVEWLIDLAMSENDGTARMRQRAWLVLALVVTVTHPLWSWDQLGSLFRMSINQVKISCTLGSTEELSVLPDAVRAPGDDDKLHPSSDARKVGRPPTTLAMYILRCNKAMATASTAIPSWLSTWTTRVNARIIAHPNASAVYSHPLIYCTWVTALGIGSSGFSRGQSPSLLTSLLAQWTRLPLHVTWLSPALARVWVTMWPVFPWTLARAFQVCQELPADWAHHYRPLLLVSMMPSLTTSAHDSDASPRSIPECLADYYTQHLAGSSAQSADVWVQTAALAMFIPYVDWTADWMASLAVLRNGLVAHMERVMNVSTFMSQDGQRRTWIFLGVQALWTLFGGSAHFLQQMGSIQRRWLENLELETLCDVLDGDPSMDTETALFSPCLMDYLYFTTCLLRLTHKRACIIDAPLWLRLTRLAAASESPSYTRDISVLCLLEWSSVFSRKGRERQDAGSGPTLPPHQLDFFLAVLARYSILLNDSKPIPTTTLEVVQLLMIRMENMCVSPTETTEETAQRRLSFIQLADGWAHPARTHVTRDHPLLQIATRISRA